MGAEFVVEKRDGGSIKTSFQFGRDEEFLRGIVVFDAQHVRFAADLAVFYVALTAASGFVDGSDVPFPARRALEAGFHG